MRFSTKNAFGLDLKMRWEDTTTSCLQRRHHYAKGPLAKLGDTPCQHEGEKAQRCRRHWTWRDGGVLRGRGRLAESEASPHPEETQARPASWRHSCGTGCKAAGPKGAAAAREPMRSGPAPPFRPRDRKPLRMV